VKVKHHFGTFETTAEDTFLVDAVALFMNMCSNCIGYKYTYPDLSTYLISHAG